VITRRIGERLLCVRQVDHAEAAGRLAEAWGNDAFPELRPRDPVVAAIAGHDAGWAELDDEPVFDPGAGGPFTYRTVPLEDQMDVAARSVERAGSRHPYAGWLVSRHFASFHDQGSDPREIEWIVGQVAARARMLASAHLAVGREALHPHVLEANLDRLQLLDAISLALCHAWERWESRPMATGYGEEVVRWRYAGGATRCESGLEVEGSLGPWPFGLDRVEVPIRARLLEGTLWERPEALEEAWRAGRDVTVLARVVSFR